LNLRRESISQPISLFSSFSFSFDCLLCVVSEESTLSSDRVEDYQIGGYHPGIWGKFLTRDTKLLGNGHSANFLPFGLQGIMGRFQRDVILKVLKATASNTCDERSILNESSHSTTIHAGKEHIFQLATNEPLFPVMSFGCSAEETRPNLATLISQLNDIGYSDFAIHVGERLSSDFASKGTDTFVTFLWSMLQRNPQNRDATNVLLDHNF
ncbi:hypothetical protein N7475_000839, partial [Penicillium sp. IBT 31633x]